MVAVLAAQGLGTEMAKVMKLVPERDVLLLRAGWLQVVQGSEWQRRAVDTGRRSSYIETVRGKILDFRGRVIAALAATRVSPSTPGR